MSVISQKIVNEDAIWNRFKVSIFVKNVHEFLTFEENVWKYK